MCLALAPAALRAANAAAAGFTVAVLCDNAHYTLLGWVRPDADYDSTFTLWEEDSGERLRVKGWLFDVEPMEADA